jgi:hypothetical protein
MAEDVLGAVLKAGASRQGLKTSLCLFAAPPKRQLRIYCWSTTGMQVANSLE